MVKTRIRTLAFCVIISPIPLHLMPDRPLKPPWKKIEMFITKIKDHLGRGGVLDIVRSVRSPESDNFVGNLTEHLILIQGVQVLIQSGQFPSLRYMH